MTLPLAGIRILAVEHYGAGPFGTLHLADLGAEVIKIENFHEGGDMGRAVGPLFFAPGDSYFHEAFNRNKRSLGLDLKHAQGQEIFRRLVESSDAVFDNLRGDLPAKLGLTYEALSPANPKIVCAHLSAYGREGSRAHWPGYDYLMQAEAGCLSLTVLLVIDRALDVPANPRERDRAGIPTTRACCRLGACETELVIEQQGIECGITGCRVTSSRQRVQHVRRQDAVQRLPSAHLSLHVLRGGTRDGERDVTWRRARLQARNAAVAAFDLQPCGTMGPV